MWEERAFGNKGEGQDFSRADVLGYAVWTWPADEKVQGWLAANWERWEREAPAFFTEKWRRRVSRKAPRKAVPPVVRAKLDEAERREKNEKQKAKASKKQVASAKVSPECEAAKGSESDDAGEADDEGGTDNEGETGGVSARQAAWVVNRPEAENSGETENEDEADNEGETEGAVERHETWAVEEVNEQSGPL